MSPISIVLTTVATRDDAQTLARALVEAQLAACAQIQAIESVYRWDGAIQQESEYRLLFKTTQARLPALMTGLRERHPYELPAIVVLPAQASDEFGAWVTDETEPASTG